MKMQPSTQTSKRGFTLIELAIVILTLVILAVLIFPALASTKLRTHLSQCMDNQRQLALGWRMYADGNSGNLIGMGDGNLVSNWRIRPDNLNPPPSTLFITNAHQAQISFDELGYQRAGLVRYVPNLKIMHCPGDTRINNTNSFAYVSYAGSTGVQGNFVSSFALTNISQLLHPSDRWLWIEENDPRSVSVQGYAVFENYGPWDVNSSVNLSAVATGDFSTCRWWDGPATFHFNSDVFSFADGHVENYLWKSWTSVAFANANNKSQLPGTGTGNTAPPWDPDFVYVFGKLATVYNP